MTNRKKDQIEALNNVTGCVETYGAEVMSKLDEEGAARLALYLLDQAGLSVDAQTKVLALVEQKFIIQTEY